jgi:hypothetical protein
VLKDDSKAWFIEKMNAYLLAYDARGATTHNGWIRFFMVFYDNEQPGTQDLRATVIQQAAKSAGELSNPSSRRSRTKLIQPSLRMRPRIPSARGPLGGIKELNRALRRLYCDGKSDGDKRGKAFQIVREKVVPHLTREARVGGV